MTRSDASLKGKVKAMAKKHSLKPQELLQMYLFERLLIRLEKSDYAETFVLKGGLLISSMTGVAQRTTMDMDATVVGMDMDAETVSAAISSICSVDIGDGMEYSFERLEPIRADDEYANWRAHLRARYGKIDAPIKIDITTGDEIVPGRIEYSYPLMFEEGSAQLLSYPIETVLAEKLETVVSRGIANTRGRDFYDIHTLLRLKSKDIDRRSLREAIAATTSKPSLKKSENPPSCRASGLLTSPGLPMQRGSTSRTSSTRPSSLRDSRSWTSWSKRQAKYRNHHYA